VKILFDTDPGIDDAMALLFIAARPNLELLGITTVFGNADIETTTRNALYLTRRFGIAAPVLRGAAAPIAGERRPAPVHVHGHDGLGDLLDLGTLAPPDAEPAHRFLIRTIRAHPGEVTLVAIGPLTNLALALDEAPDIAGLVRRVVVMGGAFGWGGGRRGNVSPVAEANMLNDPVAADRVLTGGWPVTLVGLDVTTRCILTDVAAAELGARGGEAGAFLNAISRGYAAIYRTYDGLDGCCLHDVAAVACAIDPGLFTMSCGPIRVVTEGIAAGQTIQKPEAQSFPPGAWDDCPVQSACRDVDADGVAALFLSALTCSGG
jgi:inosine-uridine nucleoside N-ribohydrolase